MSGATLKLEYGETGLELDIQGLNTTVLRPRFIEGLPDEAASFQEAVRQPRGAKPLKDAISADETVAIVIPDITRALPSDRLLPWIFQELKHVPAKNFTIIVGTGTHRGNTKEELERMVGENVVANYRIVNHDSQDYETMAKAGTSPFGYDVYFNRHYVEADRRILMGFIEPHFMAGFSGGHKAVFPGVANLDAIMEYHGYENIAHPNSAWGMLEDNPTQAHIRAAGSLLSVDFLINITLNVNYEITSFFCGDVTEAHEAGCRFSKDTAMVGVEEAFPIVVTTNSGYPLDLNLYQTVKGIAAAHQIAKPGGLIVAAGCCNDGIPEHGAFKDQLYRFASAEETIAAIKDPEFKEIDMWQTQKLVQVLLKNRIQLFSELPDEAVRRGHIEPIRNIREAIEAELKTLGDDTPIAILPEGPMTIPYVR